MSSPAARLIKALGALAVLAAIVVGVPVLLVTLQLVPHGLPSVEEVVRTLSERDDGQLLRVVLAAGAWVCWGLFTTSTTTELIGLLRARPIVQIPGLRVFQQPAAALLAVVVVGLTIAPAVTAASSTGAGPAMPPLPVALLVDAHQAPGAGPVVRAGPALQMASDSHDVPSAQTHEVVRRDTLWALAERYLGDPLRYPEIVELNGGIIGPDNQIVPGTVLVMPLDAAGLPNSAATSSADSTAEITVELGDTLWGIAAETTGDGREWETVWTANQGRPEPAGAVFNDPDLIRPGWTLTVPSAVQAAPDQTLPPSSEPPTEPAPQPPVPAEPTVEPGPSTSPPPAPATTTPAVPSSAAAESPGALAPAPAPVSAQASNEVASEVPAAAIALGGGGTLLAGVSLLALRRYRRHQSRHRRPGRLVSSTPPELVPVERTLLSAGTADVGWLDRALRSLVQGLASVEGGVLPDVIAVCMTDDVLTLVVAEPAHVGPEPWTVDDSGTRWSVHRDDTLTYEHSRRGRFLAPYPTLVSMGYTDAGEHWLLDLEHISAVNLVGDIDRAVDLMRYLAAELAHNTWSEMLRVTAVGFGEELAQLNPDRFACAADLESAVEALTQHHVSSSDAMRAAATDVLAGRLHDISADAWEPNVLLVVPSSLREGTAVARLTTELAAQSARSGAVVVTAAEGGASATAGWTMTIDAAGLIAIPTLGLRLRAHQLPVEEAGALAQMLADAAVAEDRRVPPARGNEPWDAAADACGNLRVASGGPDDESLTSSSPPTQAVASVLPLGEQTYVDAAATTDRDVRVLAPVPGEGVRAKVELADPDLDRDLADWFDDSSPRPKLTLLGPVRVRAQGRLPERNPRRQFYTEVVAYLATRNGGATSEQYATAIWPNEPDVVGKTKVRQAISVVRAWLGSDPETRVDYLPSGVTAAAAGRYRIDCALVDAQLFRRLRVRGTARGSDGIADLDAALGLVTGRPFDLPTPRVSGAGGYSWVVDADSRLDHEFAAMIVDVAHVVATHHLGAGNPQLAADAATVALLSGTFEDVPLLDLVAACDALGNRAEADAYVARILANHDAEVEEDLPPRTAAILHRRQMRSGA